MGKIIFTYGLIASAVFAVFLAGAVPFWKNGTITFDNGEIVGYASMVIALSMIFFAVKSYRDKHLGGSISFSKALQLGLLITLVVSLGYAIEWEFYFNLFAPDFMDEYAYFYIEKAKTAGAPEIEVQELTIQMESAKEMYRNPVLRFGMTLTEILPVGIIICLLSAALLRKKNFLPTQTI
jgi:Protein of unknown function (DUF4199)